MAHRIAGDVVARVSRPPPPGVPPQYVLAAVLAERHRRELDRLRPAPPAEPAPQPAWDPAPVQRWTPPPEQWGPPPPIPHAPPPRWTGGPPPRQSPRHSPPAAASHHRASRFSGNEPRSASAPARRWR